MPSTYAATYNWNNVTANWNASNSWTPFGAPTGLDSTDVLVFGGAVTSPWISTNNIPATPFLLNRLVSEATGGTVNSHTIAGGALRFAGTNPMIEITGDGSLNLNTNVQLSQTLTVGGTGTGRVTLNGAVSGYGDIVKNGPGLLRFGTLPPGAGLTAPSLNTWIGGLVVNAGNLQFNNNAQSGSTSLRANAITLSTGATLLLKRNQADEDDQVETSLRIGTLNGTGGSVIARVINEGAVGKSVSNFDIVVTALSNGTYGGSITLDPPVGVDGKDGGRFIVRGTGTQTLTGTLSINKDVHVGTGATLKLAGSASLSAQTSGAIVLAGGTLILDNSVNNINRLRDGSTSSTALEPVGGGTLDLVGSISGTTEQAGRLQLGTSSGTEHRPRAGALNLNVTHNAGNAAATELRFLSYLRRTDVNWQYATVNFSAKNGAGVTQALGNAGNAPRIFLGSATLSNQLLSSSTGTSSVGWATVNGESFASYDNTLGVIPVTPTAWPGTSTDNTIVTGNANTSSGDTIVNSIKIVPSGAGQALNITGGGNLSSAAYLLAGGVDFVIKSTGGGGLTSTRPRFFYVQQATLSVQANLAPEVTPTDNKGIVKSGPGVLELTHANNVNLVAPLVLNEGTVRANPQAGALPSGEIQVRGGVLELAGGGTFSRPLGIATLPATAAINWSGVSTTGVAADDDRGSGGFAAFGADVTVNITSNLGQISWEDSGFVRSGYALVFGSKTATNRVTWSGNLGLTDVNSTTANYNAREIRVVNNPNATGDWARITGAISGGLYNDLVKSGDGTLELANGTGNSYLGATMVQEGTLLVNTNNEASFAHVVKNSATLGGNGRVGNLRLEGGAVLSPGILPGRTSLLRSKDLSVADSSAHLLMELGGTTPGGDGTLGYDQLQVTGKVELNGMDLDLQRLGSFTAAQGDIFFLILNDGLDPVEGQFADGTQIILNGQTFAISYTADSDLVNFGGGNDVALTVIPEPSTCLLLGLGLAIGLRRRRA